MGWLSIFGYGSKVTSKDKAILDLKHQRDKLKQYQKRITLTQTKERDLAKQCLKTGNKDKALLYLRKSKHQDQLLKTSLTHLTNIEDLISSIEFALVQKDIVNGLAQGAKVLKELNSEMSITEIEKIMDDTAEGIAYQKEVSDVLAQQLNADDEAEIERELQQLEERENTQNVETELYLPNVPKKAPVREEENVPQLA